ncbi:MAG TPA: hypothetical protein VHK69_19895 [Chitinophagaceae bacterium]|nr:hypothetical protein [Chitinophagaceae bacterium]
MAGNTEEALEGLLNDLIRDLDGHKRYCDGLSDRLGSLEEALTEAHNKLVRLEEQVEKGEGKVPAIPPVDLEPLKGLVRTGLEQVRDEVAKKQFTYHQYKRFSFFDGSLHAEGFKVVVNTVMKWVILLILTFSGISILKFLIHYQ